MHERGAGQHRPLLVAGVAGGVGTSTWARILRLAMQVSVEDLRVFRGGPVDVLVTSNTTAATARIGPALAWCQWPPLLVVMHTVPGVITASRSYLRTVEPHITARLHIGHHRAWLEMDAAPGTTVQSLTHVKDVTKALRQLPDALASMATAWDHRPSPPDAGQPRPGLPPTPHGWSASGRLGPPVSPAPAGPPRVKRPPTGGHPHHRGASRR